MRAPFVRFLTPIVAADYASKAPPASPSGELPLSLPPHAAAKAGQRSRAVVAGERLSGA
jgi:hypothetical protein